VSAFKPTYGRNPRHGMFPMIYSTDHPCIIGTTIADVAAVFASSSGVSAADPSSVGEPAKLEPPLASPPKIGVLRNFFPEMIQPEMNAAIAAAAEKLRAAGAEVVDFELPEEFSIAYPIYMMLGMSEGTVINMRAAETRATKGLSTKKVVATTTQSKFTGPGRERHAVGSAADQPADDRRAPARHQRVVRGRHRPPSGPRDGVVTDALGERRQHKRHVIRRRINGAETQGHRCGKCGRGKFCWRA
jgi:Asp-tRNA(Asn)/Glu-tRNA(Gln) amidotransferase A subunit family amidase